MLDSVDDLLKQFELGKMTRRDVLAAIALLLAPTASTAQASLFKGRSINHLNIRVTDPAKSEAFYRRLLGLPSMRPVQGGAFAIDFPTGGAISLCPLSGATCGGKPNGQPGDIDHFGVEIEDFDARRVESQLKAAGFQQVIARGRASSSPTLMALSSSYRRWAKGFPLADNSLQNGIVAQHRAGAVGAEASERGAAQRETLARSACDLMKKTI